MVEIEKQIREQALMRLSRIFRIPPTELSAGLRFGDDLKPSFVSGFRRNEFDQVSDDIRDVADRAITAELNSGALTIKTVGDYCDHLVRCCRTKPNDVKRLLGIEMHPAQKSPPHVLAITVLVWAVLVGIDAAWYLARALRQLPTDEVYANSISFQLIAYGLTRLPFWVLGLFFVILAELIWLRGGSDRGLR